MVLCGSEIVHHTFDLEARFAEVAYSEAKRPVIPIHSGH
jgi:hypothetical protein